MALVLNSGINESNIQNIAISTGVNSFHASLREDVETKANFVRKDVFENHYKITSARRVKALIKKIEEL